jgi:hypothetical protein
MLDFKQFIILNEADPPPVGPPGSGGPPGGGLGGPPANSALPILKNLNAWDALSNFLDKNFSKKLDDSNSKLKEKTQEKSFLMK